MNGIYVAAPGRLVPGWPANGRPINELSRLERNYVRSGDLIEKPSGDEPTVGTPVDVKPASPKKKEASDGQ